MLTLHHPTLPDVSVQVPESDADKWAAQGWTAQPPATTTPQARTVKRRRATTKES